ncbi:MAG: hypothetical protein JWR61_4806 [Ferruginibacter sp.]|nr:hypothetical protein [Ferruginibacter sp.]
MPGQRKFAFKNKSFDEIAFSIHNRKLLFFEGTFQPHFNEVSKKVFIKR